jgi:hypothetical protein
VQLSELCHPIISSSSKSKWMAWCRKIALMQDLNRVLRGDVRAPWPQGAPTCHAGGLLASTHSRVNSL